MNTRIHVIVSGKVQGVFFRNSTKDKAIELDITGWVRNLGDGNVEAVFEGKKEDVDEMVKWCREGPKYAEVKDVKLRVGDFTGGFRGFVILR
ncbi:MAG: acylphosphatase [Candidatus Methanoperedens sp.]|nr:acylphosphatase [Candidatus Methanoperedens sp.]MCE8429729.1 acylphosphatase [Candidatus Methanoperedens sp.]